MREHAREVRDLVADMDEDGFLTDLRTRRAIERCIEIIGEAAGRTSLELRASHPEISWRPIIAQRNVLAHEYGNIRHDAIWRVATLRIPELLSALDAILEEAKDAG